MSCYLHGQVISIASRSRCLLLEGFKLAPKKSALEPVQDIQFLGVKHLARSGEDYPSRFEGPGGGNTCLQTINPSFPVISTSIRLHGGSLNWTLGVTPPPSPLRLSAPETIPMTLQLPMSDQAVFLALQHCTVVLQGSQVALDKYHCIVLYQYAERTYFCGYNPRLTTPGSFQWSLLGSLSLAFLTAL